MKHFKYLILSSVFLFNFASTGLSKAESIYGVEALMLACSTATSECSTALTVRFPEKYAAKVVLSNESSETRLVKISLNRQIGSVVPSYIEGIASEGLTGNFVNSNPIYWEGEIAPNTTNASLQFVFEPYSAKTSTVYVAKVEVLGGYYSTEGASVRVDPAITDLIAQTTTRPRGYVNERFQINSVLTQTGASDLIPTSKYAFTAVWEITGVTFNFKKGTASNCGFGGEFGVDGNKVYFSYMGSDESYFEGCTTNVVIVPTSGGTMTVNTTMLHENYNTVDPDESNNTVVNTLRIRKAQ